MRITRIDIQGNERTHYATIIRRQGSDQIEVTILTPNQPDGRIHHVQADCDEDIRSMAECLQYHLDGYRGTNSDIHDYYVTLQRFAD